MCNVSIDNNSEIGEEKRGFLLEPGPIRAIAGAGSECYALLHLFHSGFSFLRA
jgi:hypothetical protein